MKERKSEKKIIIKKKKSGTGNHCFHMGFSVVVCASILDLAAGHAAMTFPKPRNSIDGTLSPWADFAYPCDSTHQKENCTITGVVHPPHVGGSCSISSHNGVNQALNGSNGQSCYWFSNGCTVGCDAGECDGTTSHVGHGNQGFLYKGMDLHTLQLKNITIPDPFDPPIGDMILNPKSMTDLKVVPGCAKPNGKKATICKSSLRTVNTQAECGTPEDYYYYSPWR
jgi:hypothetical protein